MDDNINDKIKKFSDFFKNFEDKGGNKPSIEIYFVTTEKWLSQLGRRINII